MDLTTAPAGPDGPTPPRPAARVPLPSGTKAPAHPARFRLIVDAGGTVAEAALQESCGDATLDAAAADAARALLFEPATRRPPGRKDPEPISVYLDIDAIFVPAGQ